MASFPKLDFDFRQIVFSGSSSPAALCAQYAGTLPYAGATPNSMLTFAESPRYRVLGWLSRFLWIKFSFHCLWVQALLTGF